MTSTENRWFAAHSGLEASWYDERTEYMTQFLLESRAEVLRRTLAQRTRYMTVCMENTFHPQNASALVRTCEAFGIQDIHTVETLCRFNPNVDIVRGTDKWVDIRRHPSTGEALSSLRQAGYRIVATTPHRLDCTPESFDATGGPFALVFGTEHAGISDEVIEAADAFIRIPMCGFVESLNVSASASILIYMLMSKVRSSDIDWQLPGRDRAEILFRWTMESVKDSYRILMKRFG